MRRAVERNTGGGQKSRPSKVVEKEGNDPEAEEGAVAATAEDDEAIAAFFQEVKQEVKSVHVIRKVSGYQGLDVIRLGPDFIDDDYYECTPVPLWQRGQPALNYDTFLERADDDVLIVTPIKPQTFSALFAFYRDRGPALNWDPHLTDLEEDCFYQDLLHMPSKKFTHSLPRESKKEPVSKKRVKVFKPSGDFIVKTRLTVNLQECPTVMLFEIKGVMVLETDPKFAETIVKNERYAEMVKDHIVSDTYANDYAQCFEDYTLSKHTDYKINGCKDAGTEVHAYFIVDEYIKVAAEDARRKIIEQDEAAARALAEKARLDIPEAGWKDSDSDDSDDQGVNTDILDFRTDISKYKEEEEDNRALIMDEASDDEIAMTSDDDEFEIRQPLDVLYANKKLLEFKKPPRHYPDISFSLIAMERIICMDSQQMRQADMRGLIEPEPEKPQIVVKSDEEDTKGEELDEDAMVSLIIQQHRLQEQLEQQGSIDQGVPTIILPDSEGTGDAKKEEDEDDYLIEEANAAEEAERRRQEQIKTDQDAVVAAAAAAAAAALAVEKVPEEKDEFDLAVEELHVLAQRDDYAVADESTAVPEQSDTGETKGGGPISTTLDVSSIADTQQDSGSKVEDPTQQSGSGEKPAAQTEKPELKTIVPPPASRPGTPAPGSAKTTALSASAAFVPAGGMRETADLKCAWSDYDERIDEDKRLEEELSGGVKEVIDDIPLSLPQYNPEDGLSEDEESLIGNVKKKDFSSDMAEMTGGEAPVKNISKPAAKGGKPDTSKKPGAGIESKRGSVDVDESQEEKKEKKEEDEFDDISSDETHHENSELSDHVELTEDMSTDSEASEKIPDGGRRRSSGVKMYREWGKDALDDDRNVTPGPNLRQYWNFKCRETSGMEVTDITSHPLNENIIAASYGSFRFGDHEKEGLVCIWNAKNNRSPERIYKLRAPGTSLAFSEITPFVLAVGMLDGNVVLFDVREDDAVILGQTVDQKVYHGHVGPVWQIYFLIQVDTTSNEDVVEESMLTLGDDGLLKRWNLTKGLESTIVMKVGRSTLQVPGRREKRSESLITTLSIAYTVCFLPNNSDQFLLGTEEGFIHKCSSAYKESYMNTYVGHTGPVYRVAFSNFDNQIFFSCGGDWTVRMWKLDHSVSLLTLQTGHRTIFDVACSFFSSTVFICATEYHIEVWDLSLNTLEPVVQYKPPFAVGLRKVAFNGLLNSVIIGDDEGSLTIYGLRNFPKPAPSKAIQREQLLESLLPGSKRRKEAEEAEKLKRAQRHSDI